MQRILFRIIVALLTFIIGSIFASIWQSLFLNVNPTPVNTISTQIESSPSDEKYCEVHGVRMFKQRVPIRWGYAPYAEPCEYSDRYRRAHRIAFPHTNRYVWGGCVRNESISNEVYVCLECRKVEVEYFPQASVKGK